jgi:DNA modification methylase
LTGFAPDEVAGALARGAGLTDPDAIPEPSPIPGAETGHVWLLGVHRLVCGDCTDPAVVGACLEQEKPHLMVTDPPYGVEYDPDWRNDAAQAGYSSMGRGAPGGRAVGKVSNDDRADWREAWALFPGDVAYVWHGGTKAHVVAQSLAESGFLLRAQIVWAKNNIVISRGHYHPQHEPLFYAVRKGRTGHWHGDRKQSTLWQIDKPQKSDTGHGTQKPVECMKRPIENNSKAGDAVYEPFSGSGTTIIAAEMTGRRCLAIEIDPTYVDVAIRRWEQFTGETAKLESTGETLADRVKEAA